MDPIKPLLACDCGDLDTLRYPLLASPKLDGIRVLVYGGVVLSRNWKPIPNPEVQRLFSGYEGFDGELIVGDATASNVFQTTTSGVMRRDGVPDVWLYAFDHYTHETAFFCDRLDLVKKQIDVARRENRVGAQRVLDVAHLSVQNKGELLGREYAFLAVGYEGVMLRDPDGRYKHGRSTRNEGILMKLKRMADAEAVILEVHEAEENQNEAKKDAFGRTERSSHKANKVAKGTMGKITVRSANFEKTFNIGTGFTAEQRDWFWANRESVIGETVTFKYQEVGVKDVPRFPSYKGLRKDL